MTRTETRHPIPVLVHLRMVGDLTRLLEEELVAMGEEDMLVPEIEMGEEFDAVERCDCGYVVVAWTQMPV